jgi:hypothetical protein
MQLVYTVPIRSGPLERTVMHWLQGSADRTLRCDLDCAYGIILKYDVQTEG